MIYLDNCASTPLEPSVAEVMARVSLDCFANPSSIHSEGRRAAKILGDAREVLAQSISAQPKEIVLASSGTEANNFVVASVIEHYRRFGGVHVVTSTTEHASIYNRLEFEQKRLPSQVEITKVGVDAQGRLRRDELRSAVRSDTKLLSILHANNETGVLQDLDTLFALKHAYPSMLLHLDIVQSYMKIPFDVRTMPVDFLTVSGHKIHGPKGIGFVYVRDGVDAEALIVGGAQEKYRRGGTENVAAVAGLARAVETMPSPRELHERFRYLERVFLDELHAQGAEFVMNGPEGHSQRVAGVFNIAFPGVANKEDLLVGCDLEEVMLSSTSACHSGVVNESHVLQAMGLPLERMKGAVRICFNKFLSEQEVRQAASVLARVARRTAGVSAGAGFGRS